MKDRMNRNGIKERLMKIKYNMNKFYICNERLMMNSNKI